MKSIFLTIMTIVSFTLTISAQQTSLYNSQGEAMAYIDYDEDATIFMWNGNPVAFLEKDGNDICVFGFNGSFMGWYEDGIIYDKRGYAVGARKGATNMSLRSERSKSSQRSIPSRPSTPSTPSQPSWKSSWSSSSLSEFLYFGKK